MNLGQLLFGFSGRINRAKYWLAILIYFIASVIVSVLGLAIGQDTIAFNLLNAIVGIGSFISGIAVGIKRLHDRDKSGWWLLLFYVVPGVLIALAVGLGIYAAVAEAPSTVMGVIGIATLIGIAFGVWMFVELGCLRGTVGPNQYGPDPLMPAAGAPAH